MGLLQQAYKTYESHYADVGKVVEKKILKRKPLFSKMRKTSVHGPTD